MKTLIFPTVFVLLVSCSADNQQDNNNFNQQFGQSHEMVYSGETSNQAQNTPVSRDERAVLMDRGLGIPVGNVLVPKGYKLQYDLVTNVQTGAYDRFWIELNGPSGEMLRGVAKLNYSRYSGQEFEPICQQLIQYSVNDLSNVQFGNAQINQKRMSEPKVQQYRQQLLAQGMDLQLLEMAFTANKNGTPVKGRFEVMHQIFNGFNGQYTGGFINMRMMLSPFAVYEKLLADVQRFDDGYQPNPQHDQLLSQIIDRQTEMNTAAHNQRMANQKQSFDAHQQKMQGIYAANDARNAQWMNNFRQGWSTNSPSTQTEYGQHESFVDAITERTSFDDPHLGQKVHRDGNYNYWYTDGNGQYHGTDDPNFNPSSLGNNWQSIEPLRTR